jgi:hypothetical protein
MASKKKKKDEKKNLKQQSITTEQTSFTEQEKPEGFDYGGLPQRDLKKNLGCG